MPLHRIELQPGINTQETQTANKAGWFACNLVRWRNGLLEKLAGWVRLFDTPAAGIVRGLHAYLDLTNTKDLLLGTDGGPQIYDGALFDMAIGRRADPYMVFGGATMSAVAGSTAVTVVDTLNGVQVGDEIALAMATSVGGQILPANATFTVTAVFDVNTFSFNMPYAAINNNDATTPAFLLTPTATTQQVLFANHGYAAGDTFVTDQATSYQRVTPLGSITFSMPAGSSIPVTGVLDQNTFFFTGGPYSSDYTGPVPIGILEGETTSQASSQSPTVTTLPQWLVYYTDPPATPQAWSVDNLGNYGLFVYSDYTAATGSPLLVFTPPLGHAYSGRSTVEQTRKTSPIFFPDPPTMTPSAIGSKTITVVDTAHGATTGNKITFNMKTAVGGRIIAAGSQFTVTVSDADTYTFQMAQNATTTALGTTPIFVVDPLASTQTVNLTAHGLLPADIFTTDELTSLTVSGIPGNYSFYIPASTPLTVVSVTDADNFTFHGGPYSSNWTGGGGQTIQEGAADTFYGPWISYSTTVPTMQQTWLGALPQIFNAGATATTPQINTGMLVAMPQAQVIVWGTETVMGGGVIDPLLLRFSDAGSYSSWTASATNQAGSYRLGGSGSRIVGGIQAPQTTLIFTDNDVWSMQYVGPPFIYSFTVIGSGCGLIAPLARALLGRTCMWMSRRAFFVYADGGIKPVICPVWDVIFNDLDTANLGKIFATPIMTANEIWVFYPSASGGTGECDKYVKVNMAENLWDYGSLSRSSGMPESEFGTPLMADPDTLLIQQHEVGFDDDGAAMAGVYAETGYADISDGEYVMFIDEYQQDMKWFGVNGAAALTLYGTNYPGQTPTQKGPYTLDSENRHIRPRMRARQIALRIDWKARAGFSARVGTPKVRAAPAGTRP